MRPKVYKLRNFEILGRRRPPGGFRMVQKCFLDSTSSSFLLYLLKTSKESLTKSAQKHFRSVFGQHKNYPKKSKLKKRCKKEPRKASFPWDLGLPFGQPIKSN